MGMMTFESVASAEIQPAPDVCNRLRHRQTTAIPSLDRQPAMIIVPFKQVDVFTATTFGGNPVAVILDAEGLDDAMLQRIATWTNLSETAFVLPPTTSEASYRVRIFTPRQELPFAGHPSIGTAHAVLEGGLAWLDEGGMVQECAAGLLPVAVEDGPDGQRIEIEAPPARLAEPVAGDAELLGAALGATPLATPAPRVVSNGPHWWVAGYASAAEVRALNPDMGALAALTLARGAVGVAVYGAEDQGPAALAVRCFCPADGIPEDPVTGSGNAAIAAFLAAAGQLPAARYLASQGRELGRDGQVWLRVDGERVRLGGQAVTVIDGMIRID
jgi:PhzF family phenazine biosynthesis protein